jgi:hypothetical protein
MAVKISNLLPIRCIKLKIKDLKRFQVKFIRSPFLTYADACYRWTIQNPTDSSIGDVNIMFVGYALENLEQLLEDLPSSPNIN